jgi:hypothetical protein
VHLILRFLSFKHLGLEDLEAIRQLPAIMGELLQMQKILSRLRECALLGQNGSNDQWRYMVVLSFYFIPYSSTWSISVAFSVRKSPRNAIFLSALLQALGACCSSLAPHCNPGDCAPLDETIKMLAPWCLKDLEVLHDYTA